MKHKRKIQKKKQIIWNIYYPGFKKERKMEMKDDWEIKIALLKEIE